MGKTILTASSNVQCSHSGTVSVAGTPKLTVGGNPVLLEDGVVGKTVQGCTFGSSSTTPCKTVVSVERSGFANKLTVNGKGVALESLNGTTDSTPTPGSLLCASGQTRVTAI